MCRVLFSPIAHRRLALAREAPGGVVSPLWKTSESARRIATGAVLRPFAACRADAFPTRHRPKRRLRATMHPGTASSADDPRVRARVRRVCVDRHHTRRGRRVGRAAHAHRRSRWVLRAGLRRRHTYRSTRHRVRRRFQVTAVCSCTLLSTKMASNAKKRLTKACMSEKSPHPLEN